MRRIDANELVSKINKLEIFYFTGETDVAVHDCQMVELSAVLAEIDDAPTVDAAEVVHGRWIMDKVEIGNPYDGNSTMAVDVGNCSCCGYRCEMLPVMNYCPNCGAKMDGDGNA